MARKPKLCWKTTLAGYDIKLEQVGKGRFVVTYGAQVLPTLGYGMAARELGHAIMHALACEGKLDNREIGEK